MPTARPLLDILTRDELHALVDKHGVTVRDRRQKAHLAEQLEAKGLAPSELLADLSRDRLKELCRALDLDDSGKEKAAIIARLAEAKPTAATTPKAHAPKPAKATSAKASASAAEQIELPVGAKLTIDALERYLWSAADILRGSIDSSDYKVFIFGLLFLKRLSDRFDEECDLLVADGEDPEDKDNHQFFVPKRARWPEIQRIATNIGEALNKACSECSRNRKLGGGGQWFDAQSTAPRLLGGWHHSLVANRKGQRPEYSIGAAVRNTARA